MSSQDIAQNLRLRICLVPAGEEMILHEGRIAEDFSVSRTPVRQVLQRLAYERMVETRSGVGTVIVPLLQAERSRDIKTFAVLMRAGAEIGGVPLSPALRGELRSHATLAQEARAGVAQHEASAEAFLSARSRFLEALAGLSDNPILGDAQVASHWRLIRWRVQEYLVNRDAAWGRFAATTAAAARAERTDELQRIVADAEGDMPDA